MSTGVLRACAIMLAVGAVTPALTHGQFPLNSHAGCCATCYQPRPQCHCVRFKPVVETHFRPQSFMTWRDECHTAYRCQARYERVPVVTYQTRVRYEKVPFTVRRRVPQCTTRMVPVRRVRYVPEHYSVAPACPPSVCPPQARRRYVPRRVHHRPFADPDSVFHSTPVADHFDDDHYGEWTTISSRRHHKTEWPQFLDDDEEPYSTRPVSYRKRRNQRKPFVRAPTAAMVWQTPGPRY